MSTACYDSSVHVADSTGPPDEPDPVTSMAAQDPLPHAPRVRMTVVTPISFTLSILIGSYYLVRFPSTIARLDSQALLHSIRIRYTCCWKRLRDSYCEKIRSCQWARLKTCYREILRVFLGRDYQVVSERYIFKSSLLGKIKKVVIRKVSQIESRERLRKQL